MDKNLTVTEEGEIEDTLEGNDINVDDLLEKREILDRIEKGEKVTVTDVSIKIYGGISYEVEDDEDVFILVEDPDTVDMERIWEELQNGNIADERKVHKSYSGIERQNIAEDGNVRGGRVGFIVFQLTVDGVDVDAPVTEVVNWEEILQKYDTTRSVMSEMSEMEMVNNKIRVTSRNEKADNLRTYSKYMLATGLGFVFFNLIISIALIYDIGVLMAMMGVIFLLIGEEWLGERVQAVNIIDSIDKELNAGKYVGYANKDAKGRHNYISVELEGKHDGTIIIKWPEQDTEWVIEGQGGVPHERVRKIFGDNTTVEEIETALVREKHGGEMDGFVSECGDWVLFDVMTEEQK